MAAELEQQDKDARALLSGLARLCPQERGKIGSWGVVFCGGKAEEPRVPNLVTGTFEAVFRKWSTAVFCSNFLWWQACCSSAEAEVLF